MSAMSVGCWSKTSSSATPVATDALHLEAAVARKNVDEPGADDGVLVGNRDAVAECPICIILSVEMAGAAGVDARPAKLIRFLPRGASAKPELGELPALPNRRGGLHCLNARKPVWRL